MESRTRHLFLAAILVSTLGAGGCSLLPWVGSDQDGDAAVAADDAGAPAADGTPDSGAVVDPRVERRRVAPPRIDTEDFEVQAYAGQITVEDFGSNPIYGVRAAYHATENIFLQATYAQTGDVDRSSVEVLNSIDLLSGDRQFKYYDLSVAWSVLPGEAFFGRKRAFNTALYLLAGAGNSSFHNEDLFTITYGAGYRVLLTDGIAIHLDVRDHVFDDDITGKDKSTHNVEYGLGVGWFF
jgi:outer membrane beta-barrel protein